MDNRGRKITHVKDIFPSPSSRPRTLRQSSSGSSVGGSPRVPRSPAGDPRRLLPDLPMHDGSDPLTSPVISPLASPQTYNSSPLEVSANEAYTSQPKRGVPSVPTRSFDQSLKRRSPTIPTSPLSMSSNGLPTEHSPIITAKTTCEDSIEVSISLSDDSSSESSTSSPVFTRTSFAEKLSNFQNNCDSSRPSSQLLKSKTFTPLPLQNIPQPTPPRDIPLPTRVSPLLNQESPPTPRVSPPTPRVSTPTTREAILTPQESPLTTLESPITPQESPLTPRVSPPTTREAILTPQESPLLNRESPLPPKYTSQPQLDPMPQLFSYDCMNYGGDFLPTEISDNQRLSMTRSLKAGSTGTTGSTGSESSQSERSSSTVAQEQEKFPGSEDFGEYLDDDDDDDKEMRRRRVNNIHELRRSESHKVRDVSMIGRMLNRILKRSSSHVTTRRSVFNTSYMDSKQGQADPTYKSEYNYQTVRAQKQS